ncbi:MAG TPA: MFS transporter [Wenzhouxiangella sp.]
MFDFANQAYTLLIITVVFGDVFTRLIVGPDAGQVDQYRHGNLLWSVALALSYALVVVTNPMAGAIMDSTRLRKTFLFFSYIGCVVTTACLWFVEPGLIAWAMVLIIASNFFYAIGESFVASFLPGLGPREDLGFISGLGWGLGYVGGLVATVFALLFLGEVSQENFDRMRWVGPFAAIFFLLTALPTFLFVKDRSRIQPKEPNKTYLALGWHRIKQTHQTLSGFGDLRRLLWSIFFMMAGLYIVISFAFIYGAQVIGWDESVRVIMFVTVQLSATLGAFVLGWAHGPWGAKRTYITTLVLWLLAITAIWQTPALTGWVNAVFGLALEAQYVFLFAGLLAGLSLGASQSAGRALVGAMTPRTKAAEFFGYWGTVSKAAAIVGILGLGLLQSLFGLENAIMFCLVLMMCSVWLASAINVDRGITSATRWRAPA